MCRQSLPELKVIVDSPVARHSGEPTHAAEGQMEMKGVTGC